MAGKNMKIDAELNLQLNVGAESAKKQLLDLQQSLKQVSNIQLNVGQETLTEEIQKASQAALELSTHLTKATNLQTGNLDFTKFIHSLSTSEKDISKYTESLLAIGNQGKRSFVNLANSIASSEIPLKRTSKLLDNTWDNLKKTIGWQFSSSLVHGFIGSIQQAVGYAQDLNKSLTDIRIVTGQSSEQMALFAREANAAAKNLSTTTTDYTKASLIYYQQGLSDAEVKERTETTIKMANATGTSAQKVSDQMTAIWNNYDNGTKSLTHYADVMTALGAATASSTDEIAQGLQKFASISDTVGLSYEYAASALATVTATSRESADVVGNSFKTLFSRIQGLQLGETLDDGTTLNKYSNALASVGISIKDASGGLKDMDNILDELGEKWQTLGRDQQMALAQTVAGVRQYTQLMTLMENWDVFKQNLNVANSSAGTLDRQAAIYAESWEAASNRVRASWEGLWDSFINSDSFITALDGFSKIIGAMDTLISSMGGGGSALAAFGGILTKVFKPQLTKTIADTAYNLKMMMPGAQRKVEEQRSSILGSMQKAITEERGFGKNEADVLRKNLSSAMNLSLGRAEKRRNMTDQEILLSENLEAQLSDIRADKHAIAQSMDIAETAMQTFSSDDTNRQFLDSIYVSKDRLKAEQELTEARQEEARYAKSTGLKNHEKGMATKQQQTQQAEQRIKELWDSELNKGSISAAIESAAEQGAAFSEKFKKNLWDNTDRGLKGDVLDYTAIAENMKQYAEENNLLDGNKIEELFKDIGQGGKLKGDNSDSDRRKIREMAEEVAKSGMIKVIDGLDLNDEQKKIVSQYANNQYDFITGQRKLGVLNTVEGDLEQQYQNLGSKKTGNIEDFINGAEGLLDLLSSGQSLNSFVQSLQNGTATFSSAMTSIVYTLATSAMGFAQLKNALGSISILSSGAATGIGLFVSALAVLGPMIAETIDNLTLSNDEYRASIARSTSEIQGAVQTTSEIISSIQSSSETHLNNIRTIESYSQNPATLANDIYEANKQSLDMISEYGKNWIEGRDYQIEDNGLIKISESALNTLEEQYSKNNTELERTANLAAATSEMENSFLNIKEIVNGSAEAAELLIAAYEKAQGYIIDEEIEKRLGNTTWEQQKNNLILQYGIEDYQTIEANLKRHTAAANNTNLISKTNVQSILAEEGYDHINYDGYRYLQNRMSQIYDSEYQSALQDSRYTDISLNNIDSIKSEITEYLETQNKKGIDITGYKNGIISYLSEGIEGTQTVELETIKRWQAEQKASNKVLSSYKSEIQDISKIYNAFNQKGADALLSFKEFGSFNQTSVKSLQELQSMLNNLSEIDTQTLQDLGFDINKLKDGFIGTDTVLAHFNNHFKDLNLNAENLNFESLQQFYNDTKDNGPVVEEYVQGLIALLNSSELDSNEMATALSQIFSLGMNYNGSDNLWLQDVLSIISELGGQTQGTLSAFIELQNIFDTLSGTAPNLSELIQQLITIQAILNSIKTGDSIDEATAAALKSAGFGNIISDDGAGNYYVSGETTGSIKTVEGLTYSAFNKVNSYKSLYDSYIAAGGNYTSIDGMRDLVNFAQSEAGQIFLKGLGYSDDEIASVANIYNNAENNLNKISTDFKASESVEKSINDYVSMLTNPRGAYAMDNITAEHLKKGFAKHASGIGDKNWTDFKEKYGNTKWFAGLEASLQSWYDEMTSNGEPIFSEEELGSAIDEINTAMQNGQTSDVTLDNMKKQLMSNMTTPSQIMDGVNAGLFVDENGIISSDAIDQLSRFTDQSETAMLRLRELKQAETEYAEIAEQYADAQERKLQVEEALDAYNRAPSDWQEENAAMIEEKKAELDSIEEEITNMQDSVDNVSEAQRAYDLAQAIEAVAAARGLDADAVAYHTEQIKAQLDEGDAEKISAEELANMGADLAQQEKALANLNKEWTSLKSAIESTTDGSDKGKALKQLGKYLDDLTNSTTTAGKSFKELSEGYQRFIDEGGNMQKVLKGDRKEITKLARAMGNMEKEQLKSNKTMTKGAKTFGDLYDAFDEGMKNFKSGEYDGGFLKPDDFVSPETLSNLKNIAADLINNYMADGLSKTDAINQASADLGMGITENIAAGIEAGAGGGQLGVDGATIQTEASDAEPVEGPSGMVYEQDWTCPASCEEHKDHKVVITPKEIPGSQSAPVQANGLELFPLGGAPTNPKAGGGGGGGGKPKEPKKVAVKRKSQIVKRYKENDFKRESATKAKKSEENKKDYLYGEQKIAQLEKINKLAEKEAHITADRIKESREYLVEDRQNLIKMMQKYGFEAEFDSDGFLANYEKVWNELYEEIAALYEDNLLTEEEEKIEEEFNIKLEELEGALEDYENSLKELADDIEKYEESLFEIYDNKIEALEHKVEFKIELEEDDLEYLDFWIESLGDSVYNAIESIEAMGAKANHLFDGLNVYKQGIEDIYALSDDPFQIWATGGLEDVLTQDQVDLLRDNRDGLADYMQQLIDLREEIKDKVIDTFDLWTERIDANIASIEHYSSVIEYFKNMVDTIGKDPFGLSDQFINQLEQSAINQSMDYIESQKAYYESLVEQQAKAQEELDAARARGDESSAEHWEEVVRTTTEAMEEAQDSLLSGLNNTLTLIAEQFESAMQRAVDAFNDAIYAHGGLEGLSNDYDMIRENADLMAADYEKIYELSKLTRDINKVLDDTNIVAGKKKMNSLLKEINELQADGVELSKYDLEYLRAKYELRLAEIELENTQNSKDTVRLSKDSEGNWSYIYTQDENNIEEAEQKYEDALYEMQNLSQNYLNEMSSMMLETSQAMMDEISALRIQDFSSYEEYQSEIKRIQDKYAESLRHQENELNKAVQNSSDLYEQDWQAYNQSTGYKISLAENWVDSFREATLGDILDIDTFMSGFSDTFLSLTDEMSAQLADAAVQYFTNVDTAMKTYGTSIEGFGKTATTTIDNVSQKSKTAKDDLKIMASEMSDAFKEIADYVSEWQEEFSGQIDEMLEEIKTLIQSINDAIRKSAELSGGQSGAEGLIGSAEAIDLLNATGLFGTWSSDGSVGVKVDGKATNFIDYNAALIEEIDDAVARYANAKTGTAEREKLGEELKKLFDRYWDFRDIVNRVYDPTNLTTNMKAPTFTSMDTGGYTGEWGKEGRMAMLHEKELVLNPNDTTNFLDALKISKEVIHSMIEMNARASSMALGDLMPNNIPEWNQTLEQTVTITAEFPSATDRDEIEEAFNNLLNTASQYANRNND